MSLIIGLATALSTLYGQVDNRTLKLEEIDQIGLAIDATVTIKKGKTQKIEISGPADLIDDIDTEVYNGKWNISFDHAKRNMQEQGKIEIDIQVKELTALAVSGTGKIITKGKFGKVERRNIAISGMGYISFTGDSEYMDIALSGMGTIDVDSNTDHMNVALSGSGDIILKGTAESMRMAASGGGSIGGKQLSTKDCKAVVSGTSILTAEVDDYLNLIMSGTGVFKLSGNPKIDKKLDSSSSLERI